MANRPQPMFPEPNSENFWAGTKEGELRYQTCNDCSNVVFYPRQHCPTCLGDNLNWNVSKGEGTVYSFSVIRQNRVPAFIDLDEGFRMMSTVVVDNPSKDIQIGQRVKVEFEAQDDGEYPIPVFKPL